MAATSVRRGGARILGGPRQTGPAVARVIVTPAGAASRYVYRARTPEPAPVIRYPFARQHRPGLFPRADDQERGLFQGFRLFARETFRRRIFRHLSPLETLDRPNCSNCASQDASTSASF